MENERIIVKLDGEPYYFNATSAKNEEQGICVFMIDIINDLNKPSELNGFCDLQYSFVKKEFEDIESLPFEKGKFLPHIKRELLVRRNQW